MSNYRYIMKCDERETSNEAGRLVLDCADNFAKVEYTDGTEEYAKDFTDYHKNK